MLIKSQGPRHPCLDYVEIYCWILASSQDHPKRINTLQSAFGLVAKDTPSNIVYPRMLEDQGRKNALETAAGHPWALHCTEGGMCIAKKYVSLRYLGQEPALKH